MIDALPTTEIVSRDLKDLQGIDAGKVNSPVIDTFLRTTNPLIYAAGDVCLADRFTHVARASASAQLAVANVGVYVSEARRRSIPGKTITVLMHDTDPCHDRRPGQGLRQIRVRKAPARYCKRRSSRRTRAR